MPGKGRGKGHEEKKKGDNREDRVVEKVIKGDKPLHSGKIGGESPADQAGTDKPGKG